MSLFASAFLEGVRAGLILAGMMAGTWLLWKLGTAWLRQLCGLPAHRGGNPDEQV